MVDLLWAGCKFHDVPYGLVLCDIDSQRLLTYSIEKVALELLVLNVKVVDQFDSPVGRIICSVFSRPSTGLGEHKITGYDASLIRKACVHSQRGTLKLNGLEKLGDLWRR